LGLPSAALFAIMTLGVLLIRLVFHDPSSVPHGGRTQVDSL
jgi:hypothetical protein